MIIDKNLFKELVAENTNTNNQLLFIRHLLNCAEDTPIENKLPFQHISNGQYSLASTFSYLQLKPLNKQNFISFNNWFPDNDSGK